MKSTIASLISLPLISLALLTAAPSHAAEVGGNVKTNVKAGFILQSNKGIANKSVINLGSVSGKNTSVGGNFKSRVRVGAIIQSNAGIANKAEVNIGSVTD